jgi:hypothetical protein
MNLLESLKANIAAALSSAKAYNLPKLCTDVGLAEGDESEAFSSKHYYVLRRLQILSREQTIAVGKQAIERYPSFQLEETLDLIEPPQDGVISVITRRHVIDELSGMGDLAGGMHISEFLGRMLPLAEMPYEGGTIHRTSLNDAVFQHMVRNEDWSYKDFFDFANVLKLSERRFRSILEAVVHPEVRTGDDQRRFVEAINPFILRDGFELLPIEQTAGYPVFRIVKKGGVTGHCKNLIFAANGPKPELVLADALNNDIRIVKNQDYCLVYDRPIGFEGLLWSDLVLWWSSISPSEKPERDFYKRLYASLASEPEKRLFRLYFEICRDAFKEGMPALIPQVYLHYDPYTFRELPGGSALVRQRMDFLLLLPYRQRVVIEIDGKQHYADGEKASPKRYAEMASEDRSLRLLGYEVYRFGGAELMEHNARATTKEFFSRLLKRSL